MPRTRLTTVVIAIFILAGFAIDRAHGTGASADKPLHIVRLLDELVVDPLGNVTGTAEIVFPEEFYAKFKKLMSPRESVREGEKQVVRMREPSINNVLRYLGIMSTAYEAPEISGEFDDDAATIQVKYRILGRAKFRHGRWELPLASAPDTKVEIHKAEVDSHVCFIEGRAKQQSLQLITRVKVTLPPGASNVDFRKPSLELVYSAPTPPASESANADRPEMRFEAKPQLMSALYKLYGSPKWGEMFAARTVFQNNTSETLGDLRVRFSIDGYAAWGPWERCEKVFPGQTVVNAFYPVIDNRIAELKGTTPALAQIEYEYTRPNGEKVSETESARIKVLGMNEAVWSNLELAQGSTWYDLFRNAPQVLASFTTATDPVIQDVVGMISRATAGRGNSLSDADALKFLGTLYNLLATNIAYETTPGGLQDGQVHQHLKYGRDVLRTRSGTCVNLSILYASVCEAAGLHPYIVVVPGHAFAAVKLPQSGLPVFVETTGCGGGTRETSMSFVQARESAYRTYQKWFAEGLLVEVDIRAQRDLGIASPELPNPGPNPLKDWSIQAPVEPQDVELPMLLVTMKQALENMKIRYSPIKGKTAIAMDFNDKDAGHWATTAQTFEAAQMMVFVSQVPGSVPEGQRAAVGAALSTVNSGMLHGDFELSKEGTIAFRTSTNLRGGLLNPAVVQSELQFHIEVMQRHLPELKRFAVSAPAQPGVGPAQVAAPASTAASAAESDTERRAREALIGTWKANATDTAGNRYVQIAKILSDGHYSLTVIGNGQTTEVHGTWTFSGQTITTLRSDGNVSRGTVGWYGRNRLVYTLNGVTITYDRAG